MKKKLSFILFGLFTAFCLPSCMDDFDDPNTDGFIVTSPTSIGEVNTTIKNIKDKYCKSNAGADESRNASNFYSKVNENLIIDGVVVANDVSGNLYQTLLIRNINKETNEDQSIILAIKNTCLYPYFRLGQRLKINLNGLYAGCYSKVPRIGQPYKTSSGNLNLGPMLFENCARNIELVGKPDVNVPEMAPIVFKKDPTAEELKNGVRDEDWLKGNKNMTYENTPMLATIQGTFDDVQNGKDLIAAKGEMTGEYEPLPKIFGPEPLHDAGFGISRQLHSQSGTPMEVRTSTRNEVSYLLIPKTVCTFTGILSYYFNWQIQLRTADDCPEAKEYTEEQRNK